MRRGILGLLVLVLACVGAPANADSTYGSVSAVNGVLYDCTDQPYRYSIDEANVPADAQRWNVDLRVLGPNGAQLASDFVDDLSGTRTFHLCRPASIVGTYTIRSTFWWQDSESAWHPSQLDDAHFTLRQPLSRTTVTASTRRPAYGQRVAFRIRAFDENPSGYLPRPFAWVHLEKRRDGHWVRIRGSRAMTHDNGSVKVRVRYLKHHHRTMKVRAVTERTTRYSRSTSPVLRLW